MSGENQLTTNQSQTHTLNQKNPSPNEDLGITIMGILLSGSMFLWVLSKAFSKAVASSSKGLVDYFIQNEFHRPMKDLTEKNDQLKNEIVNLNNEIDDIRENYAKATDIGALSARISNLETSTNEIKNQSMQILVKLQEAELRQDQKDVSYKKDLHYLEVIIQNHEKHIQTQIGYLEKLTNSVIQSNSQIIKLYNREDNGI